jgi:hypothetical protein
LAERLAIKNDRFFRRIWADPVWSKVISAVILAAFPAAAAYNWWAEVVAAIAIAARFLLAATPVPNWLLGIVGLCVIVVVSIIIFGLYAWLHPRVVPSWRSYREDVFLGLKWRWRYDDDGRIYRLLPFCPSCDFQIVPHDASDAGGLRIRFLCDGCARPEITVNGALAEILDRVARHIERKIRAESG